MEFEKVPEKMQGMDSDEIEYLLSIFNSGQVTPELLEISLRDFTGGAIEEVDENVLKRLEEKGYIERSIFGLSVTQKGKSAVTLDLTSVKRWDIEVLRRWRRVIFSNKKNISNSEIEEKILDNLFEKEFLLVDEIAPKLGTSLEELEILEKRRGFRISAMSFIRRGTGFLERIAEIILEKEIAENNEFANSWRKKVEGLYFFPTDETLGDWRKRFEDAYKRAKEAKSCPLGLKENCEAVFKSDGDSSIPHRHISRKGVEITIKPGFYYKSRRNGKPIRYSTIDLIAEIAQPLEDYWNQGVVIEGTMHEIISFLETIAREMCVMRNETGLRLAKKLKLDDPQVSVRRTGQVKLVLPVLIENDNIKISAIRHDSLVDVLNHVKSYGTQTLTA